MQVERRPLVLVAAETPDGAEHSIILQNAETVKLVAAPGKSAVASNSLNALGGAAAAAGGVGRGRAVPVTELKEGQRLLVHVSTAGRHMGVAVEETLSEV